MAGSQGFGLAGGQIARGTARSATEVARRWPTAAAVGLDTDDRCRIQQHAREGMCVLGLRFTEDKLSRPERFETLRRMLGDAFEGIEIDSSPGNPHGIPQDAHSVLTVDLVNEPGHPTRDTLDRVLAFLGTRLR